MKNLLDDIIICSTTQAEHHERLKRVLKNLEEQYVVINTEKSSFSVNAVDSVGHLVMLQDVSPLQSHVEVISKLDTPTNVKELQRLFCAACFYRKFVSRFSDLVEPMNDLLREETEYAWSDQQQHAFDQFKTALS